MILAADILVAYSAACPAQGVPDRRLLDTAQVESHFQTTAIGDNTTGRHHIPASIAEAVALAKDLLAKKHSIDAGIMQVNVKNWSWLGLTVDNVFNPSINICAGKAVLADLYSIERRVSCRYNTGKPECGNGYPEKIEGAGRQGQEVAQAVFTPSPPEALAALVMVNAIRNGGPPVPVMPDGLTNTVIHHRKQR
ncbi:MAG: hypothetical protein NVS1B6_01520 [Steroidobacteraceae bacterium]